MSESNTKSSSKRKRDVSDVAAPAVSAPSSTPVDLKSWMRDVIAAPAAPQDALPEEHKQKPVEMEVDEEEEEAPAADGDKVAPAPVSRSHFQSVKDLFVCLQSTRTETLYGGLVRFHRQMKDETSRAIDGSQTLLSQYWSLSPDGKELFQALDNFATHDAKRQNSILAKVFDVLARLALPSTAGFHYNNTSTLLRKFVRSTKYFALLTRLIKMSDQRLVQSGLTFILNFIMCCGSNSVAVAAKGGVAPAASGILREFVTKFPWGQKYFLEIPYKPFQAQHQHSAPSKKEGLPVKEGIDHAAVLLANLHKSRQLFISIIVELLSKRDVQVTIFILNVKGYITSILKHLKQDPIASLGNLDAFLYAIIHHILYLPGLSNTMKFGFFNSYVLEHLLELFKGRIGLTAGEGGKHERAKHLNPVTGQKERNNRGHSSKEQMQLIERTMKEFIQYLAKHQTTATAAAIAANSKRNPNANVQQTQEGMTTLRQYGPVLLRILHSLHANESLAEQNLALDILRLFPPQIMAEFLSKFSYTFDPRVSFRWVNHIAFISKIWDIQWERRILEKSIADGSKEDFPLLTPIIPLQQSSLTSSARLNGSNDTFPILFNFLFPSTLSQRIILSQCVQHQNGLIRYSTMNLLKHLLKRFGQLEKEFEREWMSQQGIAVSPSVMPHALTSSLASHRSALSKILPDIQVLFGLRTKITPGSAESLEEMQKELEKSTQAANGDADDDNDDSARKKQKREPQDDEKHADSASKMTASTFAQALRSRHLMYSRFLSVLASYAEFLPEALIEGRIDLFKLIPSSASADAPTKISWWSLNELLNIWKHSESWKHARLFVLSTGGTPGAQGADTLAPQSYFGQLLRLYLSMQADSADVIQIVNGHESAVTEGDSQQYQDAITPVVVCERMKEYLTQILIHTGLFAINTPASSASSSISASSNNVSSLPPSSLEEIHHWLSLLTTPQHVRLFELLVCQIVNSNTAWMSKLDETEVEQAEADATQSKKGSKSKKEKAVTSVTPAAIKLSVLLANVFSSTFSNAVTAISGSAAQQDATDFIRAFLSRVLASPTLGGNPALQRQVSRVVFETSHVSTNHKGKTIETIVNVKSLGSIEKLQQAAQSHSDSVDTPSSAVSSQHFLSALQTALASVVKAADVSTASTLSALFLQSLQMAESTKIISLALTREALLQLLSDDSRRTDVVALNAMWTGVTHLIHSAEFDAVNSSSNTHTPSANTQARLNVFFHASSSSQQSITSLIDAFRPEEVAQDLFTQLQAQFLLTLPVSLTTAASDVLGAFFQKLVDAAISSAESAPPSVADAPVLPHVLQLIEQSMTYFTAEQLQSLSLAFCSASSAGWIKYIASVTSKTAAAGFAQQLLQHGGAQAIQLLATLIVAHRGDGKKKSSKSKTLDSGSFVLEELLLKLLSATSGEAQQHTLSQLQPSFFNFCLDQVSHFAQAASELDQPYMENVNESGARFFAELGALFVASEQSALYVPVFVSEMTRRFSESYAQHTTELIYLVPVFIRALKSFYLHAISASSLDSFAMLVHQILLEVYVPFLLSNQSVASKNPFSPLASYLTRICELVKVMSASTLPSLLLDLHKREQLLAFVVTGTQPDLITLELEQAGSKKQSSKKKQATKNKKKKGDSSSDSDSSSGSDSDSDEEMDTDSQARVEETSSNYEAMDYYRFQLIHSLFTTFPASNVEEEQELSSLSQSSLTQSYVHFLSQCFQALHKLLKARSKSVEKNNNDAMEDEGEVNAATALQSKKEAVAHEFESKLISTLNELLTSSLDSAYANSSSSSSVALAFKWLTMLPLTGVLLMSPAHTTHALLLDNYGKIFSSLLKYNYTSIVHMSLLRNCLLWQLNGVYSRNIFLQKIVALKQNHNFSVPGSTEDAEEKEVPSLLSICALAASPDAEAFQPLSEVAAKLKVVASADKLPVPNAQQLFELVVSHSRFVSIIAPNTEADLEAADDQESEAAKAVRLQEAANLQLEFLRVLLLLFSFPDASPSCDFKLQSNLWLLLFATYNASTSTSDVYVKLLLDLFEEILAGNKIHKLHKKMEFETIVSFRRWGTAGLQLLASKMSDADATAGSSAPTLTEMDPSSWLYTNFNSGMLYKGPVVSKKPESVIQTAVDTTLSSTAIGAPPAAVAAVVESGEIAAGSAPVDHSLDSSYSTDVRYDPSFLLPFFHHFLSNYSLDARRFIEMNGLGFIIQCMSHQSAEIRRMAYACMGKFQSVMEATNAALTAERNAEREKGKAKLEALTKKDGVAAASAGGEGAADSKEKLSKTWEAKKAAYHAEKYGNRSTEKDTGIIYSFKEYPQIALLLNVLKNGITSKYQLLPGIISTFLARSLPILLKPEHALYKSINRFLLARPLIDLGDIPLFYAYFHSTSLDWKFQRSFLLRILRDGFSTDVDYDLVHRRHVITILLNFIANRGLSDRFTRVTALQILENGLNLSANFLAELLRVHAFYPWVLNVLVSIPTQYNFSNSLQSVVPLIKLLDRSLDQIRARIPAAPEADILVRDQAEAKQIDEEVEEEETGNANQKKKSNSKKSKKDSDSSSSDSDSDSSSSDVDDEKDANGDVDMSPVDGEQLLAEKSDATASNKRKQLSPEGEALKALRKRQRQRAQIARELTLLAQTVAIKLHEFCAIEQLTSVAAPSLSSESISSATASTFIASPLSSQISVVDSLVSSLHSCVITCLKAHESSKRLTNREQTLGEGREGSHESREFQKMREQTSQAVFAPISFAPQFLHMLLNLKQSASAVYNGLSAATREKLVLLVVLSNPSSLIPSTLIEAQLLPLVVADSDRNVATYFQAMPILIQQVASMPAVQHQFLAWMSAFLTAHPRIASSWFDVHLHSARSASSHALLSLYNSRFASSSALVCNLNSIIMQLLSKEHLVEAALKNVSSQQRQAYTAAWKLLQSHSSQLLTADVVPSAASIWLQGFVSVLLQELCLHVLHDSSASSSVSSKTNDSKSATFRIIEASASLAAGKKQDKKKKGASATANDADSIQAQFLETLSPFTSQA